ncbi:DUF5103 domain-containing protein [Compostibacter hankyongensis]|uniref:DUF5103 domain-containing protein n=2 Tax=Compostibacter hankyongensis TaxID=1007089 RepID=A0ABP8FXG2_9BACT
MLCAQVTAITPDHVYRENIRTVKLTPQGTPLAYPLIALDQGSKVELSFDDLDADVKNYYYTLVLCNADWTPANLTPFDYLRGFTENRIVDYHYSSVALQRYTHYRAELPNGDFTITRPGNYLLKVYLDNDTSQLAFTRRLLVVNNKAVIQGRIEQPINPKLFRSHQKVNFSVSLKGVQVSNALSQVKVCILQNYRWDNAITGIRPTFLKGDVLEYNAENDCVFPGTKEWRWIDLQSFRLQTERVDHIDYGKRSTDVYALPDPQRVTIRYLYLKDINGHYYPSMLETGYNPDYEGDYATVHFTFPAETPYAGSDLYIFGELTNYECNESNKLTYNAARHAYEGTLLLKQGYYNYVYGTVDQASGKLNTTNTEGNWWETENDYTILVYFRPLGGRADELIGAQTLNSLQNR